MSNLLADQNRWQDYAGATPPSYWTGSGYDWSAGAGGSYFRMSLIGAPAGTDTLVATVNGVGFSTVAYLNWVVSGSVVDSIALDGAEQALSVTPVAGGILVASSGDSSPNPTTLYDGTLSLVLPTVSGCDEIGRATRNYVSASRRDRVAVSNLYAGEIRCLVTDFNGAIPKGRSIVSATWQTWDTMAAAMSAPEAFARSVQVRIRAQYAGKSRILVSATLDNGEVYTAWHCIFTNPSPWFITPPPVTGPQQLSAVVA